MKLIRHLTLQNMRSSKTRSLVTILGIILSAAMFTAVTTTAVSLQSYMIESEVADKGDYFIRYSYGTMEDLQNLQKEEAVTKLGTVKTLGYTNLNLQINDHPVDETLVIGAANKAYFEMLPIHLEKGRLPENGSELAIPQEVYDYLRQSGQPCEIGEKLDLHVDVSYDSGNLELPSGESPYEKTYTIVGITDYTSYFDESTLQLSTLLTFDDGSTEGLWGQFYVKTAPRDAYALAEHRYGAARSIREELLNLYGVTKYHSVNDMIFGFASVLMVIIMVGSVSLIYNAFSISVSEQTKQFGLLSSVGATRKQIRQCVFTEAVYLSVLGIPVGILSGYAGIAVTLHLTHGLIDDILISAAQNGIILKTVPSFWAFAAAAVAALVTVFVSAWIPAHRAAKVTPIAAIRETNELKTPKGGIQAGKLTQKLFGLPAGLARKYYTVNKRKYRATVISLTISMVLFVSAAAFTQQLNAAVHEQSNTDNFDFQIYVDSQEQIDAIRSHPALKDSSLVYHDSARSVLPEDAFTEEYREAWEELAKSNQYDGTGTSKRIQIKYLEDQVLESFLKTQGIDPALYLDEDNPLALVPQAQFSIYQYDENGRPTDRKRFNSRILKDSVRSISLIPDILPTGVIDHLGGSVYHGDFYLSQGVPVHRVMIQKELDDGTIEDQYYEVEIRLGEDGHRFDYYLRNPETGKPEAEPADHLTLERTEVFVGESIKELPIGIRENTDNGAISVILPLSAANEDIKSLSLMASASDYEGFLEFLQKENFEFTDYLKSQMKYRDYITMVRIFSYGFIILISLICICNVFNTISTNIALRKKDFGMLRSIGMKNQEMNRMIAFECLQYGLKAMLWGIPLSLLSGLLISEAVSMTDFEVPISAMAAASGCIFVTVFITMFYGVSKLKKQNPIEAIRSES